MMLIFPQIQSSSDQLRTPLTCSDVLISKHQFLSNPAAHADVHLSQKLGPCLTPAIILWQQGYLRETGGTEVAQWVYDV